VLLKKTAINELNKKKREEGMWDGMRRNGMKD